MLKLHLVNWETYSEELKQQIHIHIIDDCSKKSPAKVLAAPKNKDPVLLKDVPLPISLYEVKSDIPWNQHGCRNLGMTVVPQNEWCLLTDMDMILTERNLRKIMEYPKKVGQFYTLERKKMPGVEEYKYHCNTFVVHPKDYWKAGGYDEDYCGTYGGDGPFKRILGTVAKEKRLPIDIHFYGRDYIQDSGTNDLDRRGPMKEAYRRIFDKKGTTKPTNPIRFKWEKIF